jgi:hypothetical protein
MTTRVRVCDLTRISSQGKAPLDPSHHTLLGAPFFIVSCQIPGHGAGQLLRSVAQSHGTLPIDPRAVSRSINSLQLMR